PYRRRLDGRAAAGARRGLPGVSAGRHRGRFPDGPRLLPAPRSRAVGGVVDGLVPAAGVRPGLAGRRPDAGREPGVVLMGTGRLLIVNADDFGQTAGVNRGVIEAH